LIWDNQISKENGVYIQKWLIQTNINRWIKIYVYSGEHLPIHFHVKSEQRYLDLKFSINPIEKIRNKSWITWSLREKDEKFIKKFFDKNKDLVSEIKEKFIKLNPNLDYGTSI